LPYATDAKPYKVTAIARSFNDFIWLLLSMVFKDNRSLSSANRAFGFTRVIKNNWRTMSSTKKNFLGTRTVVGLPKEIRKTSLQFGGRVIAFALH